MKPETKRLIAAVFGAPLALAIMFGFLGLAMAGVEGAIGFFSMVFVYAFPATVILGLPIHFALKKFQHTGQAAYLIAGAVIGFIPALGTGIAGFIHSDGTWLMSYVVGFYTVPSCIFTAGIAWTIARPDQSETAEELP